MKYIAILTGFSLLLICNQPGLAEHAALLNSVNNTIVLSGKITSSETGKALQGVTVYINEADIGTASDSTGYYRVDVEPGTYTVVFRHLGKSTVEIQVELRGDYELNVVLESADISFEEIIVEGTLFDNRIQSATIGRETILISDLEQLPALMGEVDVINTLEVLPGVQSMGEGTSGFHVRGGRADQNLVLMNGAPVFNPSHVLGLFSVFNPDITDNFSLYKGHIPVRYGGFLSSVLDVNTRRGSLQEKEISGGVGLYSGRFTIDGPLRKGRTSYLLSGRGAWSELIFQIAGKDRELMRVSIPNDIYDSEAYFFEGTASMFHRISDNNFLELSLFGNRDYFRYSNEFGYSWNNRIANAKLQNIVTDNLLSETSAVISSYQSDYFTPSGVDAFLLNNGITQYQLKNELYYDGFSNHKISTGVDISFYDIRNENTRPNSSNSTILHETVNKDQGVEWSFFVSDDYRLSSKFNISYGFRYSWFQQKGPATQFEYANYNPIDGNVTGSEAFGTFETIQNYRGFEPRFSLQYSLTGESSIKASYNRTRQYIHKISNTTSSSPADIWQVSTKYIPPQTAHNYSMGLFRTFGNTWNTSIEFFYRDIDNLVEYVDFAQIFMNEQIETELIKGVGRAYGGEFSALLNSDRWTGRLSYSYILSEVRVPGSDINAANWFRSNYDQPHDVNLVLKRRVGEKSAISMNFTYKTGRPITALESVYRDQRRSIPIYSGRNQYRIPDYIRLDFSFTIAENIWKDRVVDPVRRMSDSMSFSFYNVIGRKNAFSVYYEMPESGTEPNSYKLSVLGAMLPSITYNFTF